jgi:geranylgeranyl diphosphate synthase type 3
MESKGSFEYSARVIEELREKTEGLVSGIEDGLGAEGREGAEALRTMLGRLVLR